jgi:hypothetical protein
MKFIILTVSIVLSFALAIPLTAHADDPNVCIRLTPDGVGGPMVILDVFASNKAGSRATVYALNGTASSTQATNPPAELFYLMSGTAYITTKGAIELSLTGTAEDADCGCIKEVTFHVIVDGKDDRYTQVIRNAKDDVTGIVTGTAEAAPSCGKKK